MKTVQGILIATLVGVCAAYSPEDLPDPSWATLLESSSRGTLLSVGASNTSCDAIYSCQDCSTAKVCKPKGNGEYELIQTIQCTEDRPFCNPLTGTCVSVEPDSCGARDDFVCMGNGKFPDPDCTKFHACIEYQSLTFQCAVPGEKYNARTQICEAGAPCGTFDCSAAQASKVPHTEYTGYYAFCRQENLPLVVDSCPGNYELNVTSQLCEPICHEEGILEDITDCHYYFKCTKIIIRRDLVYLERDRLKCPEGQGYSRKDFLCVDESTVENCIPVY